MGLPSGSSRVEGLSTSEVAACLGVSDDVVRTRLSRGRAVLWRLLMERTGYGSGDVLLADVRDWSYCFDANPRFSPIAANWTASFALSTTAPIPKNSCVTPS